jgi:hypothetical protein
MDDKRRDAIVQAYEEESHKFQGMLNMFNELEIKFTSDELADFNAIRKRFYERQLQLNQQKINSEIERAQAKTLAKK